MSRWRRSPARKAAQIARNAAGVIAVELIAGAQGIDCHASLKTSQKLQAVHAKVRERSPHLVSDRYWADELSCASDGCARRRDRRPRILVVFFVAPVLLSRL